METNYKARHSIPLRDPSANLHVSHYQLIIAGPKIGTSSSKKWKSITGDFNFPILPIPLTLYNAPLQLDLSKCWDMYDEVKQSLEENVLTSR